MFIENIKIIDKAYHNERRRVLVEVKVNKAEYDALIDSDGLERRKMLDEVLKNKQKLRVQIEIVDLILRDIFIISQELLSFRSRHKYLMLTRQLCMFFARKKTSETFERIGKFYGYDHATVVFSNNRINDLILYDSEILRVVEYIETHIDVVYPQYEKNIEERLLADKKRYRLNSDIPKDRALRTAAKEYQWPVGLYNSI